MAERAVQGGLRAAYADLARGLYGAAQQKFEALIAAHPESWRAHQAYGAVLASVGLAQPAEPYLRQALALDPASAETRFTLGCVLLAQGRYREGWPLYEARIALHPEARRPPFQAPEWQGEPLAGKRILVWPDEGLGDQMQFARFIPLLRAAGAEATAFASLPLARLLTHSLGLPTFAVRPKISYPRPDYWIRYNSLPLRLGLTPQTGPRPPYLFAAETRPAAGARIGLMSSGAASNPNNAHRSLPDALAARLLARPGVTSLHPDDTGDRDFADSAALVSQLDLVISVDTSAAHLAGGMAKPVWVLLSRVGLDWRWGLEGETSPWYPSARLFRQPRIGDWESVIAAVEAALDAL
jgi:tetratricopeptide (TPR) repeat protein